MSAAISSSEASSSSSTVSADGALLWLLHTLLRAEWCPIGAHEQRALQPRAFEGNVNLLPTVAYSPVSVPSTTSQQNIVEVRGLKIQQKLFVHFVSLDSTFRLDLTVGDYVKRRNDSSAQSINGDGRVIHVDRWICNQELLRWRLERNLYPAFSCEPRETQMGAELSKLSEPVLHRVYNFLQAPDFCRVTQANKVLNRMTDSPSLWREFLRQDFPAVIESASVPSNEKTRYIAEYKEKARRKRVYEEMIQQDFAWLMQEDRFRRGGGVYLFRPGSPGLVLPPPPFCPIIPGIDSRRDRWSFGDSDLLPFDPRGSFLDMW